MRRLTKPAALLLALALTLGIFPAVFAADAETAAQNIVAFYQSGGELASWWDMVALWGAGEDLQDYALPEWSGEDLTQDDPATDYAGYIFGAIARGLDPQSIWSGRNIARELAQKQGADGAFSQEFANIQVFSILALDAAGEDYNRNKALTALLSLEFEGGGFGYSGALDLDLTAMAVTALASFSGAAAKDAIGRAVSIFHREQLDSAGFESWGEENSNTLSAIISALVHAGEGIDGEAWIKSDTTLTDALLAYQLDDGSFIWSQDETSANMIATQQALIALGDLAAGKSVFSRLADANKKTTVSASVRIEGIQKNVLDKTVSVRAAAPTALDAIIAALEGGGTPYEIAASDYGAYIKSIDGESAGKFGGWDGWLYTVDGESPSVGVGSFALSGGEQILLYYGMPAPDTLVVDYAVSPDDPVAGGTIKITVTSTYYDWATEKTVTAQIEGASVNFGGKEYLTNEDGVAVISDIKQGSYTVAISKDRENSYPGIVRVVPFEVTVREKSSRSGGSSGSGVTYAAPVAAAPSEQAEAVSAPIPAFSDLAEISDWALEGVLAAREKGVFAGNEKGEFLPKTDITRAQFAAVIVRALGLSASGATVLYGDVSKNDWFFDAVNAASGAGILLGYAEDNTFRPNDELTREMAAAILGRAFSLVSETAARFSDEDAISDWARPFVNAVCENGIMRGEGETFSPKKNLTREMAALIIVRALSLEKGE